MLGANGSGKTSLLRVILGLQALSAGTVTVADRPVRRGSNTIGYIQQHRRIDPLTPLHGRDLVRQGLDGHRWGLGVPRRETARTIDSALDQVGARHYADRPVGLLSGGEQQRLRIAQALVANPQLLLCDEPLLSLDPRSQREITALVDRRRRTHATPILFVTHEINPVLPLVDRVLYLADGQFRIGTVEQVLTSDTLSELYGTSVDVIHRRGGILLAGLPGETPTAHPQAADASRS